MFIFIISKLRLIQKFFIKQVLNTQVASYFDVVDNAIAMSDTNKKYFIDIQATLKINVRLDQAIEDISKVGKVGHKYDFNG